MEKKDLKTGTVVELRDGSRFMVMPLNIPNTDTTCFLVNTESFMSINSYSNDLYHESSVFKDIMKVYHPSPDDLEHMLHCLTEIIWRRQEIDWSAFTEDTKVLVLMEGKWKKAYFSHVDEYGIHVFANGKSSFTANDDDDNFIVDVEDIVLYKKE